MSKVCGRIEKIADEIINTHNSHSCNTSLDEYINKYIEILSLGIETISYMKKQEYENWDVWYIDEWYILRKLLEELLRKEFETLEYFKEQRYFGRDIDKQKIVHLSNLTNQLQEVLWKMPYVREEKVKIETINDWIKDLKIYRLNGKSLKLDYYQSSDDLYQDMEKITLEKDAPTYKKIYAIRVSKKLSSEENQSRLPKGINLQVEEPRWMKLIKVIQDPEFNFRRLFDYEKVYQDAELDWEFEIAEWKNNIQLLVRNGKYL